MRFQMALRTGNPLLIDAAAREMPHIGLADALAVSLAFLSDAPRFERAIVRWHARFCLEQRPAADEAQLVLAALRTLSGPARPAGVKALLEVFAHRRLPRVSEALQRWLDQQAEP